MTSLLAALLFIASIGISIFVPRHGASAVVVGAPLCLLVLYIIHQRDSDKDFLVPVFLAGLLLRVVVGVGIFAFGMQDFFGGDAFTYDTLGEMLAHSWRAKQAFYTPYQLDVGWGMVYLTGAIYSLVGRNMLAVQFVNATIGAATAPIIYLCAQHIFSNSRVARTAAVLVALYPSLILWSAQALKDGPMVFLLAVCMLTTLKLGERFGFANLVILIASLGGIVSLRFYVFYMVVAAIGAAFIIGLSRLSAQTVMRQILIIFCMALAMTYFGVIRSAGDRLATYGNLEALQRSRLDQAVSAKSGFEADVDVSTTGGALRTIPTGIVYLLFAPFPWQLASLRQSITLPEMIVWWMSFPLLVMGLWFTLKYRMRQALPILIFTTMLTLAYSVFQGNVGTAYRQRSQLLVFYFIFVAVGYVLVLERKESVRSRHHLEKDAHRLRRIRLPEPVPSNGKSSGPEYPDDDQPLEPEEVAVSGRGK